MKSTSVKILIVDDQPESVEMLVLLLRSNLPEAQLSKALSGFDALDLARREMPAKWCVSSRPIRNWRVYRS